MTVTATVSVIVVASRGIAHPARRKSSPPRRSGSPPIPPARTTSARTPPEPAALCRARVSASASGRADARPCRSSRTRHGSGSGSGCASGGVACRSRRPLYPPPARTSRPPCPGSGFGSGPATISSCRRPRPTCRRPWAPRPSLAAARPSFSRRRRRRWTLPTRLWLSAAPGARAFPSSCRPALLSAGRRSSSGRSCPGPLHAQQPTRSALLGPRVRVWTPGMFRRGAYHTGSPRRRRRRRHRLSSCPEATWGCRPRPSPCPSESRGQRADLSSPRPHPRRRHRHPPPPLRALP
eukprot:COSAG04_NODE_2032_length_4966_cov_5.508732_4_plen_294_part_00